MDPASLVGRFDHVQMGDVVVQDNTPRYLALHKPSGYVSATVDSESPTVIDVIAEPWAGELHLAGRLDKSTTGLVILTNDSRFSEALTRPESRIAKVYRVQTDGAIPEGVVSAFRAGIYMAKEKVMTQAAEVEYLPEHDPCACRLTIFEGKHHQVKRMFARFGIRVVGLHREAVGPIRLGGLALGCYRVLSPSEVNQVLV